MSKPKAALQGVVDAAVTPLTRAKSACGLPVIQGSMTVGAATGVVSPAVEGRRTSGNPGCCCEYESVGPGSADQLNRGREPVLRRTARDCQSRPAERVERERVRDQALAQRELADAYRRCHALKRRCQQ